MVIKLDEKLTAKKELLLMSAARLYSLGVDVEGAREKLRNLVSKKVPYESREMVEALKNFQELDKQWKETEHQYLQLRKQVTGMIIPPAD